jgi:hypothetical protein
VGTSSGYTVYILRIKIAGNKAKFGLARPPFRIYAHNKHKIIITYLNPGLTIKYKLSKIRNQLQKLILTVDILSNLLLMVLRLNQIKFCYLIKKPLLSE